MSLLHLSVILFLLISSPITDGATIFFKQSIIEPFFNLVNLFTASISNLVNLKLSLFSYCILVEYKIGMSFLFFCFII